MLSNLLDLGEGLKLKRFSIEDAPAIFELIDSNREHLSQFNETISIKYPSLDLVKNSISNPLHPEKLKWGIWDNLDYTGSISIEPCSNTAWEIGFYLGRKFEGNGRMTRSVMGLTNFAFKELKAKEIFAGVVCGNLKSIAVLKNANYTPFFNTMFNMGVVYYMNKN